jgi:cyclic pyranopterin phosphate synthase
MDFEARSPATPPDAVLRLSVTDRCDFRCRYCMPPGGVPRLRHDQLLTFEELTETAAWLCRELGITRIKLTGGEPLVRGGVVDLVRSLAGIPGVEEVSATSNGTQLKRLARPLREAGLARVNVSVDTLDPDRFAYLTRGGRLDDTAAGIDAAIAAGLGPIKLNTVLLASSWRDDVPALLDFAQPRDLEVRFIELMRTGTEAAWAEGEFVAAAVVRAWLGLNGQTPESEDCSPGPARITEIQWRGAPVQVGWITPRSRPFCEGCTRLRMDARGRLRRCLMDPAALELAELLATSPASVVRRRLHLYLAGKRPASDMASALPMVSVGG